MLILALCCFGLLAAEVWAFSQTPLPNNTSVGMGYRGSGGDEDGLYLSKVITSHGVTYELIQFTVEACCVSCGPCEGGPCGIAIWGEYYVNDQGCNPGPTFSFDNAGSPCTKCDSDTIAHFVRHAIDGGDYSDNWAFPSRSVNVTVHTECYCCETLWSPDGESTLEEEIMPRIL